MSTAILVLGMHRSGTSALTRILDLLGADLGDRLLPAAPENPAGFWEHADIVDVHERLLESIGRSWSDPRPIPADLLQGEKCAPFRDELQRILRRDFAGSPLWAVKDPRLCRLLPLWIPLLDEMGIDTRFLMVNRDPRDVAASLGARNGMPAGLSHLLWLGHVLPAERGTRDRPRSILTYGELLQDWRRTIDRIGRELGLEWPRPAESAAAEVGEFLDPSLRHHGSPTGELHDWLALAVTALSCPQPDSGQLDSVAAWLEDAGELFIPWADQAPEAVDHLRALVRDRSGRLARMRERVRELEAAGLAPPEPAPVPAATTTAPVTPTFDRDALLNRDGTEILRTYESPEGSPRVSIVIPLYDRARFTANCLESIAAHTRDGSYEVILVDNASTDETADLLACLEGNVKIVRNEKNLGFATACNQGAALAATDAILFLNNDTEAISGWLDPLLATLKDPAVGIVGSKLLFPNGTVQHVGVALLSREGAVPLGAFHLSYGDPADAPETAVAMEVPVVTGACMLVRRALFEELGGFDPFFWNGCEDIDLCLKAGEKGRKVVVQPASVLMHHESMSGPERFSRTGANEKLLASRWAARAPADYVQDASGNRTETGEGRIRPYSGGTADAVENGAAGDRPVVSIVILTCNQLPHTRRCLESVERFTPEPHEIVIVDNGSTDGTVEWLHPWAAGKDHVQVIRNADNHGFGGGCNAGMALAHGRDLVLLNNDTIVTEGWLGGMLTVLDDHPDAGIIGPMTNRASGPQVVPDVSYGDPESMHVFAAAWSREHAGETMVMNRMPAFCWLVRRDVVDAIGGFDECFGLGNLEDDDFCLRAAQVGWCARIARGVFVHHVGSRTFDGENIDYDEAMERNFAIFKTKWGMDPAMPVGSYPFRDLAAGPHPPKSELPRFRERYDSDPGIRNSWVERMPEAPPAEGTHRLRVGVIGEEPRAAVEALFRRHGHDGPIPVFRTGADVEAALRLGGEVLAVAPDVVLPEDSLRELVEVMRANPEIGALAATSNGATGIQHVTPSYANLDRDLARFAQRRRRRHRGKIAAVDAVDPVCLLLRPEAVARAGGLRADAPVEVALAELWPILIAADCPVDVARGAYVHCAGPAGASSGTKGGVRGTAGRPVRAAGEGTR